ncbi:MAG: hypothetical protein LC725_05945, partial [Lentisphaerae bacterium]|nr:hypothetical protein [Lentisphaerota bacterium]
MRKKRKKEVVHVEEVDRQLPVKHQPFPDLDELNRLVQNIIADERRQARRTFFMITSLLAAFFILLLAGMSWFT